MYALIVTAALCQFDVYGTSEPVVAHFDVYGAAPVAAVADDRPLVILYATAGCEPCNRLKKLIEAGALPEFRFEYRADLPDCVNLTPMLHYSTRDGWKMFRAHQFPTSKIPEEFRKAYAKWQTPKATAPVLAERTQTSGGHWSVNGNWSPSREEVIQHLLNDGEHRGRHSRRDLESKDLETLLRMHDADHGSVAVAPRSTKRRGLIASFFCPTCP